MVRISAFLTLATPVQCARVAAHTQYQTNMEVTSRGLEVLSLLKENPDDQALQEEYKELIGDVELSENVVFLETGLQTNQAPVQLGTLRNSSSVPLVMAEKTGAAEAIGRWLTSRRDYVFEEEDGESKYVFDGNTMSLHSRMHVTVAGEETPRFILRRAFSYLNPIAGQYGQFIYRVIQCNDPHDGTCSEGDILYTISKDRLGRGGLWGMDEYRVYTGTGGCRRWGHGVLGCDQNTQVLYSLGAGLSEGTFDTDIYKGNILSVNDDGSARIQADGGTTRVGASELNNMKVAHTTKTAGPPRRLNWASYLLPPMAAFTQLARTLIWTDAYRVHFEGDGGDVDDLLVSMMVAAHDLTRDRIAARPLR
jgi:hypothetical protein